MTHKQIFFLITFLLAGGGVWGQLSIDAVSTDYTIDFEGTISGVSIGAFAGAGFEPTPSGGRLDSDAWSVTGWSNGDLVFGGTQITGNTDYTRGISAVAVTTGGIYSFTGPGSNSLGIQPGGSDWAL
ncbi:MAG: hypothetical protein IPJ06_19680 [Saprospiraceae bacterium]|nr:hypothetical protein [Saprospiraceae bacterium]